MPPPCPHLTSPSLSLPKNHAPKILNINMTAQSSKQNSKGANPSSYPFLLDTILTIVTFKLLLKTSSLESLFAIINQRA